MSWKQPRHGGPPVAVIVKPWLVTLDYGTGFRMFSMRIGGLSAMAGVIRERSFRNAPL
jgi:hypothetical protein